MKLAIPTTKNGQRNDTFALAVALRTCGAGMMEGIIITVRTFYVQHVLTNGIGLTSLPRPMTGNISKGWK